MTDQERAAIDAAFDLWARNALTHLLVALTIVATLWLIWQKLHIDLTGLKQWIVSSVSNLLERLTTLGTIVPNLTERTEPANERTNEPTRMARTALHQAADRLVVDRTRPAVIAVLVAAGWKTTDIRNVLKGTAADIGQEVKAVQAGDDAPRTLLVDGKRTIAL